MIDAHKTLGTILEEEAQRDAIHVALAPVVAAQNLKPGQSIGFVNEAKEVGSQTLHRLGIVDPFLEKGPKKGQRFWMMLYPNTITSLRHEWTHPAFSPSESEAWIRGFAEDIGISYAKVLESAKEWIEYGDYHSLNYDTPERAYRDIGEFWRHYEAVTQTAVDPSKKASFFSCAC